MRKLVVHMQVTLDGRISNNAGYFWEPLPFGDLETSYVNDAFRSADTWAMSRKLYQFVVPYWEQVAAGNPPEEGGPITPPRQEFAELLTGLTKIVFSTTLTDNPATRRVVISDDIGAQLAAMKQQPGQDIVLSAGPRTLGPLADQPGLVDEYLLVTHPAVLAAGPRLFEHLTHDLALDLVHAEVFEAGAVIARYAVRGPQ
jgi:dihydrofolate reductase